MNCKNKPISVYKGFGTRWNDTDLLNVSFDSDISVSGFSAEFSLGGVVKEYNNIENGFAINLSAAETGTLEIGPITGSLVIIDRENNKKPFSTELPFMVKDWEDGDIELDGFNIVINSKVQRNSLVINISGGVKNPEEYSGYDSTKVQSLKNIRGDICWVDG